MQDLIMFIILFIFIYLFYFVFVLKRKNVLSKFPNGKECTYLKYRYKLKINDSNINSIANKIFLINSFILSSTVSVVMLFDSLLLGVIVGIVTLIILILVSYHILGTSLKKKQGGKKNV